MTLANAPARRPVVHVDARGLRCPWPALRLAKAMRAADEATIEADDPAAPGEIAALAVQHGWELAHEDAIFRVTRRPGFAKV